MTYRVVYLPRRITRSGYRKLTTIDVEAPTRLDAVDSVKDRAITVLSVTEVIK